MSAPPAWWYRLPNGLTLVALALALANYFSPCADLDFAWQIRTGELIVTAGNLRPPESFTYTIAGQSVPDFEWLYEVILWCIWTVFGHGGLKLLRTALVLAPLLLLAWRLRREGIRWHGVALAVLAAALALSPA